MMGLGKPQLHAKFEVARFSRCKNIKGEPQTFSELPGPVPLFLRCVPILKSQALAIAAILTGNPKYLGVSLAQGHVHFLLCVRYYDGSWQTQAIYQI